MSVATGTDIDDRTRRTTMLLLQEQLARERMRDAHRSAATLSRGRRLAAARRWQRRAERASHRARLALAAVG